MLFSVSFSIGSLASLACGDRGQKHNLHCNCLSLIATPCRPTALEGRLSAFACSSWNSPAKWSKDNKHNNNNNKSNKSNKDKRLRASACDERWLRTNARGEEGGKTREKWERNLLQNLPESRQCIQQSNSAPSCPHTHTHTQSTKMLPFRIDPLGRGGAGRRPKQAGVGQRKRRMF